MKCASTLCGFRVSVINAKDFTDEEKKEYKKNNSKANTRKNKNY
jgi:hypothetical protein